MFAVEIFGLNWPAPRLRIQFKGYVFISDQTTVWLASGLSDSTRHRSPFLFPLQQRIHLCYHASRDRKHVRGGNGLKISITAAMDFLKELITWLIMYAGSWKAIGCTFDKEKLGTSRKLGTRCATLFPPFSHRMLCQPVEVKIIRWPIPSCKYGHRSTYIHTNLIQFQSAS